MENIEKLLQEEIREKKKAGIGVFKRATRIGTLRGGFKTPHSLLKGKDKKLYENNGKVERYNMYERIKNIKEVPTFEQIKALPYDTAREIILALRNNPNISNKALKEHWGFKTQGAFYYYLNKYDIPKCNIKNKKDKTEEIKLSEDSTKKASQVKEYKEKYSKPKQLLQNKFSISYSGFYTGKQIKEKILNMVDVLDDDTTCLINFLVTEEGI